MLPPFRGEKDGWFKLKNVQADARSIRAKAALHFINNQNKGTIWISGKAGDYVDQCADVGQSTHRSDWNGRDYPQQLLFTPYTFC